MTDSRESGIIGAYKDNDEIDMKTFNIMIDSYEEIIEHVEKHFEAIIEHDIKLQLFRTDGFGGVVVSRMANVISIFPASQYPGAILNNYDMSYGNKTRITRGAVLYEMNPDSKKKCRTIFNRAKKHQLKDWKNM